MSKGNNEVTHLINNLIETIETNENNERNIFFKKNVKFQPYRDIYFIPNRMDLRNNYLINEIWWSAREMAFFKYSFFYSYNLFLLNNPNMKKVDYKIARQIFMDAENNY